MQSTLFRRLEIRLNEGRIKEDDIKVAGLKLTNKDSDEAAVDQKDTAGGTQPT